MIWSYQEERILKTYYGKIKVKEIQKTYLPERTIESIETKARSMGLESNLKIDKKKATVEFIDLKLPPGAEDMESLWKALEQFQNESRKLSTHQDEVTAKIITDEPIVFTFLADLHIGAIGTYYKELRETVDLLASTDNVFVGVVGDTIDNFLPEFHPEGQFGDIIPPEVQKRLAEYICGKLKGKITFLVQGCHDEASHEVDDFDWTKFLQEKLKCFNLGFGGFVNLKVGEQTYRICARHKYRGGSSQNPTSIIKKMRNELGDFDIGVIAHNHQPALEWVPMPDKERIFVRPGSYKRADRYARSIGFMDNGCFMPSVILFPKERRMIPLMSIKDAVDVLKTMREEKNG